MKENVNVLCEYMRVLASYLVNHLIVLPENSELFLFM